MSQHLLLIQGDPVHDCPNAGEGFCMPISDNCFDCSKQLLRDTPCPAALLHHGFGVAAAPPGSGEPSRRRPGRSPTLRGTRTISTGART
jgi:hypothetical protein